MRCPSANEHQNFSHGRLEGGAGHGSRRLEGTAIYPCARITLRPNICQFVGFFPARDLPSHRPPETMQGTCESGCYMKNKKTTCVLTIAGAELEQAQQKTVLCYRRRRLERPECLGVAPVGPEDAPRAGPERAGHGVVQRPDAAHVRETILILVPRGTTARI